jgi:hypothetical protein
MKCGKDNCSLDAFSRKDFDCCYDPKKKIVDIEKTDICANEGGKC